MASVVIPTKDEEKIFNAIERAKLEDPDEIIVVNEKSSSKEYTETLEQLDGIKYFEVEGGTAKARNRGAKEAGTDKILFLDADCYPTEGWHDKMSEALEETDLAEGEVKYIGKRCPLNRIVENRGEENRFLTANLGVRKEVFEEVQFDEHYDIFREDTDFGWTALKKGFENQFVHAPVEHDAGRYTVRSFIRDRMRYKNEYYFFNKFRDFELLETEVDHIGPLLYPKELAALALIAVLGVTAAFNPLALTGLAGLLLALKIYYLNGKKDLEFCPKDYFVLYFLLPISLFAKHYSILRGYIS